MYPHGAAKRLIFSLLLTATMGGCAVYSPYPADYAYYPGYNSGYYPGYYPYGYSPPLYSGVPYYVGPPVTFDLWFSSGYGGYGHHGYHGYHGGHHGGWGGRHH